MLPLNPEVMRCIEATIVKLGRSRFRPDPILTREQSRQHSILGSAEKRHGRVIETALRASLAASPDYIIWREPRFIVPRAADDVTAQPVNQCLATAVPYPEWFAAGRSIELDLLTYHRGRRFLGSYEIKRGNGYHDSGKQKQMRRDLLAAHVLLRSYGQRRQLPIDDSAARVIFYYGHGTLGRDSAGLSLTGAQLDQHFEWPVQADVETANEYYRARVQALLQAVDDKDYYDGVRQLELALPSPWRPNGIFHDVIEQWARWDPRGLNETQISEIP
jgi:hypothetical protein